jgi:hypothetical protein
MEKGSLSIGASDQPIASAIQIVVAESIETSAALHVSLPEFEFELSLIVHLNK